MQVDVSQYGGNRSEVARLLQQIEEEYNSSQLGLNGLAVVAKHEFITRKMENIGKMHEELQGLVSEDEAMNLLAQAVSDVPLQRGTSERLSPFSMHTIPVMPTVSNGITLDTSSG